MSIWAMAKLGYHPGRSLAEFGRRIEELVPDFNSQACANTLWGLSVLQVRPSHPILSPVIMQRTACRCMFVRPR